MVSRGGSYDDLIQIAVDGVRELQEKSPEELKKWASKQPLFPFNVPVENGFVFITAEGDAALRKLGQTWHANSMRSKQLSRTAAEKLARDAFGELLDQARSLPADADAKSAFLKAMDKRLQVRSQIEHFYFPAQVFEQPEIQTFAIGPVTFYRRADWLDAVETLAGTPGTWKADVLREWTGRHGRTAHVLDSLCDWFANEIIKRWPGSWLTRKVLRLSAHRNYVKDILKAIGTCEWVLSVPVDGRERSRSLECASVAVLVALDSFGLMLPTAAARKLRGPGHERELRFQRNLSQHGGQSLDLNITLDHPRLGGPPGAQAGLMSDSTNLRAAVGRALTVFVSVQDTGDAPFLLRRWVEAMYWFVQARREQSEFIALVKFGIALDVLADGGHAPGIIALSCAIFGKSGDDVITPDDRTLEQVVKALYNDGRSRIVHGTTLALLSELPIELSLADSFTRQVLADYVVYAARYSGVDTFKDFLAALPEIRIAAFNSRKQ